MWRLFYNHGGKWTLMMTRPLITHVPETNKEQLEVGGVVIGAGDVVTVVTEKADSEILGKKYYLDISISLELLRLSY